MKVSISKLYNLFSLHKDAPTINNLIAYSSHYFDITRTTGLEAYVPAVSGHPVSIHCL
jgi:hypothetical protein